VTARLVLRPFTEVDRAPFYALNTHRLVVESVGSSPARAESDAAMARYSEDSGGGTGEGVLGGRGPGRWRSLRRHGRPAPCRPALPCAHAVEVGWRLHPDNQCRRDAREAASASLEFGFDHAGLHAIVALTTAVNTRSQSVMECIGITRDVDRDFDHPGVPEGSPPRRHVPYRISPSPPPPSLSLSPSTSPSQAGPSVTP
jgi:RimJ/RimL family protein N-acetyltransferase